MNRLVDNRGGKNSSAGVLGTIVVVFLWIFAVGGRLTNSAVALVPIVLAVAFIAFLVWGIKKARKSAADMQQKYGQNFPQRYNTMPYGTPQQNTAPYGAPPQQGYMPQRGTYNPFDMDDTHRGHRHPVGDPEHGTYGDDLTAPSYQVWNPLGDKDPWDGPKDRDPWDV